MANLIASRPKGANVGGRHFDILLFHCLTQPDSLAQVPAVKQFKLQPTLGVQPKPCLLVSYPITYQFFFLELSKYEWVPRAVCLETLRLTHLQTLYRQESALRLFCQILLFAGTKPMPIEL